jgi:hypothetical protein
MYLHLMPNLLYFLLDLGVLYALHRVLNFYEIHPINVIFWTPLLQIRLSSIRPSNHQSISPLAKTSSMVNRQPKISASIFKIPDQNLVSILNFIFIFLNNVNNFIFFKILNILTFLTIRQV